MALREGDIPHIKGAFKGEKPDPDLHHFNCTMVINKISMVIRGDKQLLYRGTKLMNTEYIFGLVVYTGKNTKIMKNS
jgi:phospholipid-transporting ATPase